tara:strand:+ start:890 stop:1228 length:339 start_codon:yes stop_codon:yes gene_type:complete
MNINEYIENYSTINVDKATGIVTVLMEVPQRMQITYKHQECDASQRVKLSTNDIKLYLVNSGMEILSDKTGDSIDNNGKLTAVWEYNTSPVVNKKNNKHRRKNRPEETEEIL